jgi:antitoxin component of MazEF toxin-antitoxin module
MEVVKTPIIRKIFQIGNSKAVCIPKDWLEYYEKETGTCIEAVAIEVNRILKIAPLIPKPTKQQGE